MGCDIHMYVEARKDGKWESADQWCEDDDGWRYVADEVYDGRNYNLFAILANVRNRLNLRSITPRRGIPMDMSKDVKKHADAWGLDAHSFSWLTLAEIQAFDWSQEAVGVGLRASYSDLASDFLEQTLPRLQALGDPDDVRIVFWFDN